MAEQDTKVLPLSRPSRHRKYKKVDGDDTSTAVSVDSSQQNGNTVTKAVLGLAHKASDSTKGAIAKVKRVAEEEATSKKDVHQNVTEETDQKDDESAEQLSKKLSMGKVASATKTTLSKPLSMTKNIVKSTGSAVRDVSLHRKKSQKRDSNLSEPSVEEEEVHVVSSVDGDTEKAAQEQDDEDDSTVIMSNSFHVKETMMKDEKTTVVMICMGPVLAFLLHDATIAIGTSLLIALYPTIANFHLIMENSIPWSVTITWILVAFSVGYEVALFRFVPAVAEEEDVVYEDLTIPSEINVPMAAAQPTKRGYSMLRRLSVKFPKVKIQIPQKVKSSNAWSSLTTKRGQQLRWQRGARGRVSDSLMKRLLRNPMYQRSCVEVEETVKVENAPSEEKVKAMKMGSCGVTDAESLKEDVIEPQFVLRGMDVFMTEDLEGGAEDNMSEHPFLIENGLRDTPSFVINMMSQWANILVYFELPDWIKGFDNIVEEEDDPDDVKALKRFLNGNDEYKSLRLKMLPFVVDGPYPIRMMAPPKRELTIHCDLLPTKWRQHDGCARPGGRYLYPCLELELDLMANKTTRGFGSLVKRYLCKMTVDVAIIVKKPDLQEDEELSACVGLWRFDKVDLSQCPKLPGRLELGRSVRADAIRASMLMQQTEMDLLAVREELESIPEPEAVAA